VSVRLEAVTAGYVKGVPILRSIDLVVAPQSITTVIGPNGSGNEHTAAGRSWARSPSWTG